MIRGDYDAFGCVNLSYMLPASYIQKMPCPPLPCPPTPVARDLNDLLQHLSADLEDARTVAETDAKRAEASTAAAGQKGEKVRRLGDALATMEARLAASDR